MSRETIVEEIPDPTFIRKVYTSTIKCDKCGRVIDPDEPPDGDEDLYAQELIILLNVSLCVNSRIKLDLCRTCLTPIWSKICAALDIDPDDEHRIGEEEND